MAGGADTHHRYVNPLNNAPSVYKKKSIYDLWWQGWRVGACRINEGEIQAGKEDVRVRYVQHVRPHYEGSNVDPCREGDAEVLHR